MDKWFFSQVDQTCEIDFVIDFDINNEVINLNLNKKNIALIHQQ